MDSALAMPTGDAAMLSDGKDARPDDRMPVLRKVANTAPIDEILAIYREDGGLVIKNFLTPDQLQAFNADLDPYLGAISPGAPAERGEISEFGLDFFGRNTKRMTNVVERSRVFREEILDTELYHALGDAIFGTQGETYWLAAAQIIEIGPDSAPQELHRDLEGWPPFYQMGPQGPEIVLNFLVALTDFTDENGGTRIIPGSHLWDFEDRGDQSLTIPVEMNAGDAVFYSGKVIHGGGANRTKDFYRRAIIMPLLVGFLTPEEAFPLTVSLESAKSMTARAQRLVGYRTHQTGGEHGVALWASNFRDVGEALGL